MTNPGTESPRAYQVLAPLRLNRMASRVVKPSMAVMVMVSGELCVRETDVIAPSPQSMAVEVNAMMQKGHLGSSASKNQAARLILGLTALRCS